MAHIKTGKCCFNVHHKLDTLVTSTACYHVILRQSQCSRIQLYSLKTPIANICAFHSIMKPQKQVVEVCTQCFYVLASQAHVMTTSNIYGNRWVYAMVLLELFINSYTKLNTSLQSSLLQFL